MERTYEAPSNEAPHMILGYHWGRSVTYLHFPFFSDNGKRLSQEPHQRLFRLHVRLPQSDLTMVLLYWFELQSIPKLCIEL